MSTHNPSIPQPHRFSRNPLRRRRRQHSALTANSSNHPANQPKPIYIYPGLLRVVRDKAIALDSQCPAVHYKCRECRKDPNQTQGPPCSHQASCSICLDEFHGKDLVRRLPCNINHVFHSKCILDWFISHHRCPLCNEPVSNNPTRPKLNTPDHRLPSSDLHPSPMDSPFSHLRRARSYNRAVPTFTMDRSREARLPPQERRLSDSTGDATSHTPSSTEAPAGQTCQDEAQISSKAPQPGEKPKKKNKGPRRYSYIVHDSVRMEMNPVIPA